MGASDPREGEPPQAGPPADTPPPRVPTMGRVALFLWVTSFFFLFIYELLTAFFRLLAHLTGWRTG